MSKLFKLKEWLTISEAAKYLAVLFGEEVSEADVLRLGLDGHLVLSVNFVNEALAECGAITPINEARTLPGLHLSDDAFRMFLERTGTPTHEIEEKLKARDKTPYFCVLGYSLPDGKIIEFSRSYTYIRGVWDLCMLEGERYDVEELYYEKIGVPYVDRWTLEGVLVTRNDGYIFRLAYELEKPSKENFDKMTEMVRNGLLAGEGDADSDEEKRRLVEEHAEYRKKLWEDKTPRYGMPEHLPGDSLLVVRTEALREFEQSLNGSSSTSIKVSDNTLVSTIAALLASWPGGKAPSGKDLERSAQSIGVSVSDDSIRKALNAAIELAPTLKKPA